MGIVFVVFYGVGVFRSSCALGAVHGKDGCFVAVSLFKEIAVAQIEPLVEEHVQLTSLDSI